MPNRITKIFFIMIPKMNMLISNNLLDNTKPLSEKGFFNFIAMYFSKFSGINNYSIDKRFIRRIAIFIEFLVTILHFFHSFISFSCGNNDSFKIFKLFIIHLILLSIIEKGLNFFLKNLTLTILSFN